MRALYFLLGKDRIILILARDMSKNKMPASVAESVAFVFSRLKPGVTEKDFENSTIVRHLMGTNLKPYYNGITHFLRMSMRCGCLAGWSSFRISGVGLVSFG